MVLGVCRRVLDNAADADDALQATFLVLVRKAGSIRKSASLASWLHGVALRRGPGNADPEALDGAAHEQRAEIVVQPESLGAEATRGAAHEILDEELRQLPAKYRTPLVLHYFEGKTKEETARQLGWSEGTVSGRSRRRGSCCAIGWAAGACRSRAECWRQPLPGKRPPWPCRPS